MENKAFRNFLETSEKYLGVSSVMLTLIIECAL